MSIKQYFVFDGTKSKEESLTKEQIINLITQATGVTPTDPDEGFISTIKETNKNKSIHFWKGTQAEYNALATHDADTFYIIDDDSSLDDLAAEISSLDERFSIFSFDTNQTIQNLQMATNDLDGRVASLESDSGWQEIVREDRTGITQIIGKYRIIGGIVYFHIEYGVPDFGTTTADIFSVPFDLTVNNTQSPKIPFFYTTHDSQYYQHSGVANVNRGYNGTSTIHINTVQTSGVEFVYLTFSFPIQ